MFNITHTGALCSHGTKNNQHNSTQPQKQPHTMFDGNICSDDKNYRGFGAAMANSLCCQDRAAPARAVAEYNAAPARAMEAVVAVHAPGTK